MPFIRIPRSGYPSGCAKRGGSERQQPEDRGLWPEERILATPLRESSNTDEVSGTDGNPSRISRLASRFSLQWFVLEFLDLKGEYSESELEAALIGHADFLLELGGDSAFLGASAGSALMVQYRPDFLLSPVALSGNH